MKTGGLGIKRKPDGVDEKPDLQETSQDDKSVIIVTVRPTSFVSHRRRGRLTPVLASQGANFSGKSVYLKQIALITFMAHIGASRCFKCALTTSDTLARQCRLLRPRGRRPHRLDGPHHDEGVDEGVYHEGELQGAQSDYVFAGTDEERGAGLVGVHD